MNKTLTIISLAISVTAIVGIFTSNIYIMLIVFFAVILLSIGCFGLEKYLNKNGNVVVNRLFYYLSRSSSQYIVLKKFVKYEYISRTEMKYERDTELKVIANGANSYDQKFKWSANDKQAIISPKYEGQEISYKREELLWNCYTILFNHSYNKKDVVMTGSVITNLIDTNCESNPFLSIHVYKKIKCLHLLVKIPKELEPTNARLEIYNTKNGSKPIKSEDIVYDERNYGYQKCIEYPRRGWKYVIAWDFKKKL